MSTKFRSVFLILALGLSSPVIAKDQSGPLSSASSNIEDMRAQAIALVEKSVNSNQLVDFKISIDNDENTILRWSHNPLRAVYGGIENVGLFLKTNALGHTLSFFTENYYLWDRDTYVLEYKGTLTTDGKKTAFVGTALVNFEFVESMEGEGRVVCEETMLGPISIETRLDDRRMPLLRSQLKLDAANGFNYVCSKIQN